MVIGLCVLFYTCTLETLTILTIRHLLGSRLTAEQAEVPSRKIQSQIPEDKEECTKYKIQTTKETQLAQPRR